MSVGWARGAEVAPGNTEKLFSLQEGAEVTREEPWIPLHPTIPGKMLFPVSNLNWDLGNWDLECCSENKFSPIPFITDPQGLILTLLLMQARPAPRAHRSPPAPSP